jgi:hypothetical protein
MSFAMRVANPSARAWMSVALIAAATFLYVLVLRRHLIDDAYITLCYARNLAEHLHWGIISSRTANTATSALNVLLLGGLTAISRDAVIAAGVLYVVSVAATFFAVERLLAADGDATRRSGWALTITALIELNPILLSSVGLETTLFVAVMAWLAVAAQHRRPVVFGLLAGALILTRPDGIIFVAALAIGLGRSWRTWATAGLLTVAVAASWAIPSWFLLGSAVPDTVLKRHQQPWQGHSFGTGLVLLGEKYPIAVITAVAIPACCLLALVAALVLSGSDDRQQGNVTVAWLLITGGVVHYAAFAALHPPPYHWYYAPTLAAVTLGSMVALVRRYGQNLRIRVLAAALVTTATVLLAMNSVNQYPPITTNWHSGAQARAMADDVAQIVGDSNVGFGGEVGAMAYYCKCQVIDVLSDMANLNSGIVRSIDTSTGIYHDLLRANFRHRDLTALPPPFRFLMVPTSDPAGHEWHWTVTSPWASTTYVLDELTPG